MLVPRLADMTWPQVDALDRARVVALLPIGAIEAHGPHLPLGTDVVIAEAMAADGAAKLQAAGLLPLLLPALAYTPAPFAAGFAGTVAIPVEALETALLGIARSLQAHALGTLAIANAHLDPANVGALRSAVATARDAGLQVAFPDITRRALAQRLTDEFRSGACHAGQYEGSILLAARPDLVRAEIAAALPDNPASLSEAIHAGHSSFAEAGGPQAYFGFPSRATADEGKRTIDVLGDMLHDAVLEARGAREDG